MPFIVLPEVDYLLQFTCFAMLEFFFEVFPHSPEILKRLRLQATGYVFGGELF